MRYNHIVLLIIVFFIFFISTYLIFPFLSFHNIFKELISNIITFLSIILGFYFTCISILFSSKYMHNLKKEDSHNKTQRLIHTLITYFKSSIYTALITIIISMLILITDSLHISFFNKILFSILIALLSINFLFIILLIKVIFNIFIIQTIQGFK